MPLSKIINMTAFSTTAGGIPQTGGALNRLEHLGIPAGLVFLPPHKHENIEYVDEAIRHADTIDEQVYDKLVDLVSAEEKKPKRTTRKSRKYE